MGLIVKVHVSLISILLVSTMFVSSANGDVAPREIQSVCQLPELVKKGVLTTIGEIPCDQIDLNTAMSMSIYFKVEDLDQFRLLVQELSPLEFWDVQVIFTSRMPIPSHMLEQLDYVRNFGLHFRKGAVLESDSVSGLSNLRHLIITSDEHVAIKRDALNSNILLRKITFNVRSTLEFADRLFSDLPSLTHIKIFRGKIVNTNRAAFAGVQFLSGVNSEFDLKDQAGEQW